MVRSPRNPPAQPARARRTWQKLQGVCAHPKIHPKHIHSASLSLSVPKICTQLPSHWFGLVLDGYQEFKSSSRQSKAPNRGYLTHGTSGSMFVLGLNRAGTQTISKRHLKSDASSMQKYGSVMNKGYVLPPLESRVTCVHRAMPSWWFPSTC